MNRKQESLGQITEANVSYYFDSLKRNCLDQAKVDRRYADTLIIRDTLIKLPDDVYDATLASIYALLAHAKGEKDQVTPSKGSGKGQGRAAQDLYNQSRKKKS